MQGFPYTHISIVPLNADIKRIGIVNSLEKPAMFKPTGKENLRIKTAG